MNNANPEGPRPGVTLESLGWLDPAPADHPDKATPETATPKMATPKTAAPEVATPGTTALRTTAPRTTAPEVDEPEVDGPEFEPGDTQPRGHRRLRGGRRFSPRVWLLLRLAAGTALLAVTLVVRFQADDPAASQANRALVDAPATARAAADVGDAVAAIFSYQPDDLSVTEQAAQVLEGRAASQYQLLLAQVKKEAPGDGIALTSRAVYTGVVSLTADSAQVLVFLDQNATRHGKAAGKPVGAQVLVTARLRQDSWHITDMALA